MQKTEWWLFSEHHRDYLCLVIYNTGLIYIQDNIDVRLLNQIENLVNMLVKEVCILVLRLSLTFVWYYFVKQSTRLWTWYKQHAMVDVESWQIPQLNMYEMLTGKGQESKETANHCLNAIKQPTHLSTLLRWWSFGSMTIWEHFVSLFF